MKLSSNLRYRVVGVEHDMTQLRALKGVSCGHTWKGFGWGNCPRCGDAPADNPDDRYHWLDRKTNRPLTYKNGDMAQFTSLDAAIEAFIKGELEAEKNEVLA